jgi:aminopeptidase N
MATREEFAKQLHALIEKFAHGNVDPIDLANELQDQVNVFIGQHNLEYELYQPLRG